MTANKLPLKQRRRRSFELYVEGASLAAIADQHGVTATTTMKDVRHIAEELGRFDPSLESKRSIHLARAQRMMKHWFNLSLKNPRYAGPVIALIKEISAVSGLRAPQQVDVTKRVNHQHDVTVRPALPAGVSAVESLPWLAEPDPAKSNELYSAWMRRTQNGDTVPVEVIPESAEPPQAASKGESAPH